MDTDIHVRPCARIHTDERRKQNENETRDSRLEHSFCFCELLISYTIAVDYCHYPPAISTKRFCCDCKCVSFVHQKGNKQSASTRHGKTNLTHKRFRVFRISFTMFIHVHFNDYFHLCYLGGFYCVSLQNLRNIFSIDSLNELNALNIHAQIFFFDLMEKFKFDHF